jgi:hypothetical protein
MSFFKKFTSKFNKNQQLNIVAESVVQQEQQEIEYVDNNYQHEEIEYEEVQQNFELSDEWSGYSQTEAGPSWTSENSTWSTNDQEQISKPSAEQEELSSSSNKYIFELVLLVLVLFTPLLIFRLFFGALLLYRAYLIYPKLLLSEGDYVREMNPFEIMFSQSTISPWFQEYGELEDTIKGLVDGIVKIKDIKIIQVCIIDDIFYSSDNRRLYCFQEAIKRGLNIKKIPVKIRRVSEINIEWKWEGSYKIVRNNNFKNITVTPYARNGRAVDIKNKLIWDSREI